MDFWNLIVEVDMEVGAEVVEAKKEDNKIGVADYCHAWFRFVIAILGLAKGVPFVDLFFCFFK